MMIGHVAFAAVASLLLATTAASADPILVGADPPRMGAYGNLNQKDVPGCGNADGTELFGCGPTAAVNSLLYLQNTYPGIYAKSLVPEIDRGVKENDLNKDGKVDRYDDLISTAKVLAGEKYMNTCCNKTTLRTDFLKGKRDYIEKQAPGRTKYAAMDDEENNAQRDNGLKFPDGTPDLVRKAPTIKFLLDALRNEQDVEILIFRFSGAGEFKGGHYVTVTGLQWEDDGDRELEADEKPKIHFMNPSDPRGTTRDLLFHDDGSMYWQSPDGLRIEIAFAVEESPIIPSPVPGPPALWLLGGLMPVLAWARGSREKSIGGGNARRSLEGIGDSRRRA